MTAVRKAARTMLSAIFILGGTQALIKPQQLVGRAKPVTDRIGPLLARVNQRLPTDPKSLVRLNAAVQVGAGLLLATDHLKRPAAAVLAGSLVPTTTAGHPFWQMADPAQRREQQTHFMKNLGLFGGLLLAALDTEGRPGLTWRARHLLDSTTPRTARAARSPGASPRRRRGAARAGRSRPI